MGAAFASLSLAGFAGGNHLAVVWGITAHRAGRRRGIFTAHARQSGLNGILIVIGQFDRGFLVAFFTRQFFAFQSRQLGFITRLGFGGACGFLIDGFDLGLFLAVILHQRNIAWADKGAGAAFNAVEQVMIAGFFVFFAAAEPVKLLRQQARRAGVDAQTAADTGLFRLLRRHFVNRRGQNAVADFNDRHVKGGQGKAHERAAHHHHLLRLRLEAGKIQQMLHRRADARPQITRLAERIAGQGHYALDQRFAIDNGTLDGESGADVLHQHADGGRVLAVRHFLAEQDLGELFGAAGRVFGRDHPQGDARLIAQRQLQGFDRFRLVVFDADQRDFRLQQVTQNLRAFDNLVGVFAHQTVIGGDIRLAFSGVEDQRFHAVHAALQLAGGRETGATQPGDAGLMNALQ
ncbi:hypothetical protein ALQ63_04087 [Serratia plymuthica]|nr:hypothetical protein ALQ63_04087 [Serratia plymuthica]